MFESESGRISQLEFRMPKPVRIGTPMCDRRQNHGTTPLCVAMMTTTAMMMMMGLLAVAEGAPSTEPTGLMVDFKRSPSLGVRLKPSFTWIVPPCEFLLRSPSNPPPPLSGVFRLLALVCALPRGAVCPRLMSVSVCRDA